MKRAYLDGCAAPVAVMAMVVIALISGIGCSPDRPCPCPDPIDWESVAPSVLVEVVPDGAVEAAIEPIPDPVPDEGLPEAPIEAITPDEPVGANVPMGPETDTLSVSDGEGKLPADPGFARATEPVAEVVVDPTEITIVSDPRICPPCIQMERDRAAAELKRRWPACRVFTVRPSAGESMPTLKVTNDGETRNVTAFYPMASQQPDRSKRIAAMFAAIEKELKRGQN